jgi:hypothetical protein
MAIVEAIRRLDLSRVAEPNMKLSTFACLLCKNLLIKREIRGGNVDSYHCESCLRDESEDCLNIVRSKYTAFIMNDKIDREWFAIDRDVLYIDHHFNYVSFGKFNSINSDVDWDEGVSIYLQIYSLSNLINLFKYRNF